MSTKDTQTEDLDLKIQNEENEEELEETLLDDDEESEDEETQSATVSQKDFMAFQQQVLNKLGVLERHSKGKKQTTQNINNSKPRTASPELDSISRTVSDLQLAEKKRQFGYQFGLSPEETDVIFKYTRKPNADTLKDPFVQGGLEALRSKKNLEDNSPGSSPSTYSVGGKKWTELTKDERQASLADRRRDILARKRG